MKDVMRAATRELTQGDIDLINEIKEKGNELAVIFEKRPPSRELSLALTNLQQAVMWAVNGVTA